MKFDFSICFHLGWWRYTLSVSIISLERYEYVRRSSKKEIFYSKFDWNLFPDLALEGFWVPQMKNGCQIYAKLFLSESARWLGVVLENPILYDIIWLIKMFNYMRLFVHELIGNYIIVHEIIVVSIIWFEIRTISFVKSSVLLKRVVSAHKSYDTVCISYELYHIVL